MLETSSCEGEAFTGSNLGYKVFNRLKPSQDLAWARKFTYSGSVIECRLFGLCPKMECTDSVVPDMVTPTWR